MNMNPNIVRWVDSLQKQEHRKWWANGEVIPLTFERDSIPAFTLSRPPTGAAISILKIVSYPSEVETNILSNAITAGLEVVPYDDYDLIIYPSVLPLGAGLQDGNYYLKMSDGTNTWYTDVFAIHSDLSDYIKIEYWHSENFYYRGGHIRYQFPYKSRVYVCSDIGRPSYLYKDRISERKGRNLPLQKISYKLFRFKLLATEATFDAFRLIRLHDFIKVFYNGYEYDADDFLMEDVDWKDQANIGMTTVEFTTDEIFVEVNGSISDGSDYGTADGTCIPQTGSFYSVKTQIEVNTSDEWTMGHYTNMLGVMVDFEVGDYVILRVGENAFALYSFNAPNDYTLINLTGFYTKIYIENTGEYLYDRGDGANIRRPRIIGLLAFVVPATYYGETMEVGITDLYLEDVHGNQTFFQRVTNADLQGGVEIDTGDARYIVLKVSTLTCGVIMEDRFEIVLDYTIFTGEDDDDSIILTGEDDDDSIIFGDPDLDSITYP